LKGEDTGPFTATANQLIPWVTFQKIVNPNSRKTVVETASGYSEIYKNNDEDDVVGTFVTSVNPFQKFSIYGNSFAVSDQ
jgi:hypothetical protein